MLRLALAPALAVALLAPVASCKKDAPPSGLPPAKDWNAEAQPGAAPRAENTPGTTPGTTAGNPHGDMANPHRNMGGVGGGSPHGPTGGMGGDPSGGGGTVAQQTQPRTLEKLADNRRGLGPFSVAVPADWTEKPITSSMRAGQFQLPGASGEAELVIYYFGETGAGGVQANLDRWIGQFQQPDGKKSEDVAKIEKTKIAGQEATIVSVSGRYVTTSMPGGGDPIDKAEQSLLGVIVDSPKGPYYFKLVGPKQTVDAQGPKLRALLASLKLR
jgi:hypothetical protein